MSSSDVFSPKLARTGFCALAFLCGALNSAPALAGTGTSSGLDTPSGVIELPLAVNGVAGIDLAISGYSSQYAAASASTPNVLIPGSVGIQTTNPIRALTVGGGEISIIRQPNNYGFLNVSDGAANGGGNLQIRGLDNGGSVGLNLGEVDVIANTVYFAGYIGVGITNPGTPLTIGKTGAAWGSAATGRTVYVKEFVNGDNQTGGGIAISDDGGFFDWNDGYITYEPLCCGQGLKVDSTLTVNGNEDVGGVINAGQPVQLPTGYNSGEGCSVMGMLAYSGAAGTLLFCNGSVWKAVSSLDEKILDLLNIQFPNVLT